MSASYTTDFRVVHLSDDSHAVDIPCLTLAPEQPQGGLPHIIFFTRFGEQRHAALETVATCFAERGLTSTAVGVPFDKYSLEIANWLLDDGLQGLLETIVPKDTRFVIGGDSRGAAIAASLAPYVPCSGLYLLGPLGLTSLTAGDYTKRILKNQWVNRTYLETETYRTSATILGEVLRHTRRGGLFPALQFAMTQHNRVERAIRAMPRQHKLLGVFAGETDLVFPPAECLERLETLIGSAEARKALHTVPRGHTTIASPTGKLQLDVIAQWLADQYK